MDYGVRIARWLDSLTDRQLAEARSARGALPRWLIGSLRAAGIKPISYATPDGEPGTMFLMPTAVADSLERMPANGRYTQL